MEFNIGNGKSVTVPNDARENPRIVVAAAMAVWNKRISDAATGRVSKLQQGVYTVKTTDGKTVWMVRPRQSGLEFYAKTDWGVSFERPIVEPTVTVVGIPEPAPEPAKPTAKKTNKRGNKK